MEVWEAVARAREMLENVTPLKRDCGRICGAACCAPDEDGQGGMLLFPGEERLYEALPPGCTLRTDDSVMPGMKLMICSGVCERSARPLSCRIFPLTPVLSLREGRERLSVRMDPRAFSVCPLCENGVRGMDEAFARAVMDCGRLLNQCEEHRAYLRALGRYFERLRIWPGECTKGDDP